MHYYLHDGRRHSSGTVVGLVKRVPGVFFVPSMVQSKMRSAGQEWFTAGGTGKRHKEIEKGWC